MKQRSETEGENEEKAKIIKFEFEIKNQLK